MAAKASTPSLPSRSMLGDIIDSIFTPGTNSGLIRAMEMSFYALFVVLAGMVVLTRGNGHVCALFALSIGLFASIKWFLVQIAEAEEQHRRERLAKEQQEAEAATKGGKAQ
ncbi:hypothetical protein JCM10908_000685 [Rhodotorula pacifica]|uniref:Pkr1p n=1 Tax=Rhodotorula pacifica TaxID=1495444 RepID=UPI00317C7B9E